MTDKPKTSDKPVKIDLDFEKAVEKLLKVDPEPIKEKEREKLGYPEKKSKGGG